jgi:hypothetical protein
MAIRSKIARGHWRGRQECHPPPACLDGLGLAVLRSTHTASHHRSLVGRVCTSERNPPPSSAEYDRPSAVSRQYGRIWSACAGVGTCPFVLVLICKRCSTACCRFQGYHPVLHPVLHYGWQ